MLADGKLYVGTESGKFFIIRPQADRAEVLSEVELPISTNSVGGSEGTPEQIVSGAAISRGRVFFVSSDAVYAIGPKAPKTLTGLAVDEPAIKGEGAPAYVQVSPTELTLQPGQTVKLRARLFDAKGRFLREEKAATGRSQGLKGTVTDGTFTVGERHGRPGRRRSRRRSAALTGEARARVVRAAAWTENVRRASPRARCRPAGSTPTTGKFTVVTLDGQKVLQKAPDNTLFKRIRMFIGLDRLVELHRRGRRAGADAAPSEGDIGITAQRYSLVLYGTSQRLKIEPWEPETDADGHDAVRVEARRVVSPQAAGREPAERRGAGARQGVADRRA